MKTLAAGLNFRWSWVSRCMNFQEREVKRIKKVRVIDYCMVENV